MELTTLKRLVGTDSTTNTEKEKNMAQVIYDIICENEYFRENPQLCGLYQLPGDALGRKAVWALHRATAAAAAIHSLFMKTPRFASVYAQQGWIHALL